VRHPDERRQLLHRLAQAGEPHGDARQRQPFARLHLGEGAHVAQDAVEEVLAAHLEVGLASAASSETRSSSSPLSASSRPLRGVSRVPLVLNST
jgi:hypothetical protein